MDLEWMTLAAAIVGPASLAGALAFLVLGWVARRTQLRRASYGVSLACAGQGLMRFIFLVGAFNAATSQAVSAYFSPHREVEYEYPLTVLDRLSIFLDAIYELLPFVDWLFATTIALGGLLVAMCYRRYAAELDASERWAARLMVLLAMCMSGLGAPIGGQAIFYLIWLVDASSGP